jgi:hypothetical protein
MLTAMSLERLRARMPLVAFILLAVVCLLIFGSACACLSDHPLQALNQALGSLPALPALIEVWSFLTLLALAAGVFVASTSMVRERSPSPASLQRFLR